MGEDVFSTKRLVPILSCLVWLTNCVQKPTKDPFHGSNSYIGSGLVFVTDQKSWLKCNIIYILAFSIRKITSQSVMSHFCVPTNFFFFFFFVEFCSFFISLMVIFRYRHSSKSLLPFRIGTFLLHIYIYIRFTSFER